MSVPRLTFLYPHLFKSARVYETSLPHQHLRPRRKAGQKANLSISARCRQETYTQRYGSANQPNPPPPLPLPPASSSTEGSSTDPKSLANAIEKEVQSPSAKPDETKKADPGKAGKRDRAPSSPETKQEAQDKPALAARRSELQDAEKSVRVDAAESHPEEPPPQAPPPEAVDKPLDHVLQIDSPEEHKLPHLQAPPYVHHFDTFTLVKDLEEGGFTEAQSVTLMKAVRSLLAINLDVAREGLVSKSDVENETYLFRAACSELRTEILSLRRSSSTTQSTQRAHLQHEVDILSQRSSQEALALKDDLRGLLNDRKMNVRMETRDRDSEIQELDYKITVTLNSAAKNEVEGLRWFLIRRYIAAIALSAVVILIVL
ncbi:MAG: hypothetical protein Q9191_006444, partial [Dirinaria sp. TL-2023a]